MTTNTEALSSFRHEFILPSYRSMKATKVSEDMQDSPCTYLCGNSLGALPKRSKKLVEEELAVWGSRAVEGHFDHPHDRQWTNLADAAHPIFAELVGANESEVACMGTLTANLHLLMNTFYKPKSERYKILCEAKAFPSDQYAFASQVQARGYSQDAIVEMSPRPGEFTLREEDILATISEHGQSIALVLFSGVQYYTGQWFPMQSITKAAQAQGCICGWDLAHAVGNVPLSLHEWNVDFAVWCTYKYLNAGPGAIGGLFVHDRWASEPVRHAGWWGHDPTTRFAMPPQFKAIPGAQGFQQSNPSVLATASLIGSLQVFHEAGGMAPLRERSLKLTGHLDALLKKSKWWISPEAAALRVGREDDPDKSIRFTITTPSDPASRGSQLSLLFLPTDGRTMPLVMSALAAYGVIGDSRKPDVIRLAPTALYNTMEDVERAAEVLEIVMHDVAES